MGDAYKPISPDSKDARTYLTLLNDLVKTSKPSEMALLEPGKKPDEYSDAYKKFVETTNYSGKILFGLESPGLFLTLDAEMDYDAVQQSFMGLIELMKKDGKIAPIAVYAKPEIQPKTNQISDAARLLLAKVFHYKANNSMDSDDRGSAIGFDPKNPFKKGWIDLSKAVKETQKANE